MLIVFHRHHPNHHHHRAIYDVYDACVFYNACDDAYHDGHNKSNNVHASIRYDNESCHKMDHSTSTLVLCLSLPIYDSSHSGGNACNSHTPPAYACRKSLLFQEPNRHSPNYYHIFCNNHPIID